MDSIASRLTAARKKKGWTQGQLAKSAGVSQGTVGNIESGVRMSHGSLPRLAEALEVPHNWLRDGGEGGIPANPSKSIDLDQTNPTNAVQAMRAAINTLATMLLDMEPEARREAALLMQELAENPSGRWAARLGDLIEKESITQTSEVIGISDRQGNYPLSTQNHTPTMAPKSGSKHNYAVDASALPTGADDESTDPDRNKDQGRGGGRAAGSR